jgi:hypothetical protein
MTALQPDDYFKFWKTLKSSKTTLELFNKHLTKSRSGVNNDGTGIICNLVSTTLSNSPLCSTEELISYSAEYFEQNLSRRLTL